ncbi:T9SS type A sorting domain-containing protein [Salibacter halophilus]|uniref:T9SS type A sorting domain-containing protein n=1 Tax=Salibacter halophilus TaxID=1803916 RepID=A0A6N6M8D9_9FLAO|nr:T9SS type A sorting domain-containing protein [Salibacter halophilus]KAB1063387.1 T9SS type A sorting domain-containing protein [Salibacter halophilus]
MKKLTLLSLILFLSSSIATAQYYAVPFDQAGENPGGLNTDNEFPVGGGLPGGWNTISTGPSTTWTGQQSIPFNFSFNGSTVSNYNVHPSGVLTFSTSTTTPATPSSLPDASIPDSSVCAWGLSIENNDYIVSKTFGSAPNRQHWIMFNSAHSAGTQDGWVYLSFVLEESSNKIYVVDQRVQCIQGQSTCTGRPSLSVGIQIDNSTAIQPAGYDSYAGSAENGSAPDDNGYVSFIPGTQPANDVALSSLTIDDYLPSANAPFSINGEVRNMGSATLNNFDINYTINGGSVESNTISNLTINTFNSDAFNNNNTWSPSSTGAYTIKAWVSNPNGSTDGDNSNDTLTKTVEVVDTVIQRMPFYEVFTSSTCGPCRPGNENFHNTLANYEGEFVALKYQQNFPGTGDPYATDESVNRRNYYSINSIPRMEIDGGWDENANAFDISLHNDARAVPSFVSIDIEYDLVPDSQKVYYDIDVESFTNLGNNNLYIAIVEDTTTDNVKTNGETEFFQVMKKMIPDENGQSISLSQGSQENISGNYVFEGDYRLPADGQSGNRINHLTEHSVEDFESLYVIAWVQNSTTNEVHQAAIGTEINENPDNPDNPGDTTSISSIYSANSINLYPNPTNGNAKLSITASESDEFNIAVYDVTGKQVMNMPQVAVQQGKNLVQLQTANLNHGMYYVAITTNDGQSITKKLVVK